MADRATQVVGEFLGKPASAGGRATGAVMEVLGQSNDPGGRTTAVAFEVLCAVGNFELAQVGTQSVYAQGRDTEIAEAGVHVITPRSRLSWVAEVGIQVVTNNPPPEPPAGRGFWVCAGTSGSGSGGSGGSGGSRLVGAEDLLTPGPWEVEYPRDPARALVETAAATAIMQQPASDPRVHAWIWRLLPTGEHWLKYDRLIHRLETLLGSRRVQVGLSETIWIKDDVTAGFRKWSEAAGAVTGASTNLLEDSLANWPVDRFRDGVVEILSGTGAGQRRGIYANTATELTLASDWDVDPALDSMYRIRATRNDWVEVRVLNVPKMPTARATVEQHLRLEFVVIDPLADDWG